jgi:hypothetical protein
MRGIKGVFGRAAGAPRAKVVNIGMRRAGRHEIIQRSEEAMTLVVVEHGLCTQSEAAARVTEAGVSGAPALSSEPSMPSVSPAIAWMPCCPFSVTTRLSRNSTLRPSLASYRNGGLPAGISTQGVAKRRLRQSSVCHGLNPIDH